MERRLTSLLYFLGIMLVAFSLPSMAARATSQAIDLKTATSLVQPIAEARFGPLEFMDDEAYYDQDGSVKVYSIEFHSSALNCFITVIARANAGDYPLVVMWKGVPLHEDLAILTSAALNIKKATGVTVTLPKTVFWLSDNGIWFEYAQTNPKTGEPILYNILGGNLTLLKNMKPSKNVMAILAAVAKARRGSQNDLISPGASGKGIGLLRVAISPDAAVAGGALWYVDKANNGWHISGETINVKAGRHVVTFLPISGWIRPGNQKVAVMADVLTTASATYQPRPGTGTLQVTVGPDDVTGKGLWYVDRERNGWHKSGATVKLKAGAHTVAFRAVGGWVKPVNQAVTVSADALTTASGIYQSRPGTGKLQVTINPVDVVKPGAMWYVDKEFRGWHKNGETINLAAGQHLVVYHAVKGWTPPADQWVSVTSDTLTTTSGTYQLRPGNGKLQVTISPDGAVASGALWHADGSEGAWHKSGETVSLRAGRHAVVFRNIASWYRPANQWLIVTADATTTTSGTYQPMPAGKLQVTINPDDAVTSGALWFVDREQNGWHKSGETINLLAGSHVVVYRPLAGWTKPSDKQIAVTANETATTSGTYQLLPTGTLQVTISPDDAVTSGALWYVDRESNGWHKSGDTISLPVGNHIVVYRALAGWVRPGNQPVIVTADQPATASGTYQPLPIGKLQVTIGPDAVASKAMWCVDQEERGWHKSGETINLMAGSHVVVFSSVSGWVKPGNQLATVTTGQTATASATYLQRTMGR